MDLSALAQIAPVLAAGFTKNPQTVTNTINMSQAGGEQNYKRKLRDFGRQIFASGQLPDAGQIVQAAQVHGIRPQDAMEVANTFMNFRRQKQQMAMGEKDLSLKDLQMQQGQQGLQQGELGLESARQKTAEIAAIDAWRKAYDPAKPGFDMQQYLDQGRQLGQVPLNTVGPLQGEFRKGTVYAQDQATGLPQVFQQGPMPQTMNPASALPQVVPGQGIYDRVRRQWVEKFPQEGAGPTAAQKYLQDPAKLVDDTRSFYAQKMRGMIDPMTNMVIRGKEEEYQAIIKLMEGDMQRIATGQIPAWLSGGGTASGGSAGGGGGTPQPTHDYIPGKGFVPLGGS